MMKKQNIRNKMELAEFLDRPFVLDYLYPIYGEKSVDTLFSGWTYTKKNSWHEFRNPDGDILDFYPEETYVIKSKEIQLKIPRTIGDFINDINQAGININYSE